MKKLISLLFISNSLIAGELDCLAKNIYFEARGEPEAGQFMVGFVTINRVRSDDFPDTICEVVYQKNQFEWTTDSNSNTPLSGEVYNKAVYIASIVMQANNVEQYGLYFKGKNHKSKFFDKLTYITTVDNHEFYR